MEKTLEKSKGKFFEEIHFLRAFACIGVVLVHLSASYYNQHDQTYNWLTFALNQLGRFGTPTFALISGFLLFHQVKAKGFDFQRFLKSRFTKIVMPFVIWSIFYLLINVFVLKANLPTGSDFIETFLTGATFYHLYFMVIVIQFYFIFPLLQSIRTKRSWMIALVLSFITSAFFINLSHFMSVQEGLGAILSNRVFIFTWIFYFIFGGFLAYYWRSITKLITSQTKLVVLVVAVYLLAIYEYKIMGSIPSNRMTNLINIPLLSMAVIGLFPIIQNLRILYKPLKLIGTLSMGIYLVHPLVLLFLNQILPHTAWATRGLPIMYVVVMLLSIAIVQAIRKLSFVQYIIPVPRMQK
ncbi:acyltransferase [Bacillus sp. Marseille-Q3570]|uniref:acyltransferase n=1 Tax=Bacillus sp. Marseille-Q3570 TaxID=2963522 RepID=UPI0021B70BDC|nr:acyltransferase [Bacillus sp. Marseille-Q3570]